MAEQEAQEVAKPGLSKLTVILVALVALLAGTALALGLVLAGVVPLAGEAAAENGKDEVTKVEPAKPLPPPIYIPLEPPFIVNFERPGRRGFLQITIQGMSRDPKVAEALEKHKPVIRNNLLMLFASKTYPDIEDREGKEALRREALAEVNAVLEAQRTEGRLEELYFTGFVMQ